MGLKSIKSSQCIIIQFESKNKKRGSKTQLTSQIIQNFYSYCHKILKIPLVTLLCLTHNHEVCDSCTQARFDPKPLSCFWNDLRGPDSPRSLPPPREPVEKSPDDGTVYSQR